MKLLRQLSNLPDELRRGAVAIGNFDGVHRGHARIVDRVRGLHTQAEELPPWDATDLDTLDKRAQIADQIARQTQRISVLQAAVITLYVAIGLLVGASLTVGLSSVVRGWGGWVPVGFGLAGASSLLAGAVMLIREARMAVRSTLAEMEYTKRMVARRTGAPLPTAHLEARPNSPGAAAAPVPAAKA